MSCAADGQSPAVCDAAMRRCKSCRHVKDALEQKPQTGRQRAQCLRSNVKTRQILLNSSGMPANHVQCCAMQAVGRCSPYDTICIYSVSRVLAASATCRKSHAARQHCHSVTRQHDSSMRHTPSQHQLQSSSRCSASSMSTSRVGAGRRMAGG